MAVPVLRVDSASMHASHASLHTPVIDSIHTHGHVNAVTICCYAAGQGFSLAVEDAVVLAWQLQKHGLGTQALRW